MLLLNIVWKKKLKTMFSVIFIAFKNFENKMKDPDFEYKSFVKCVNIKDKYDLSLNTK